MEQTLTALIDRIDRTRVPRHIAVIMDGNGRWAKQRGLPRSMGHSEGVVSVRKATEICSELGVEFLTLYAFSTENWNRPQAEVDALMHLIGIAIEREKDDLIRNNVRLRLVGAIGRLPEDARRRLIDCADATSACTGLTLGLCLSYSARWDITEAARKIAAEVAAGTLDPDSIGEATIASHLDTVGMPDPDLLIRTGGEHRISNFLLWQIAYSELYFTTRLWPDFGKEAMVEAIIDFQTRERRFGKTSEQIRHESI